ncbi:rRNA-binding ribosome biosynthesis protein rpf2 [Serendipita sp. 405]|nr:rRNA-binding ribosome biosynthesis protein rpf2 [Serendipita sp. 405]
MLRTVVPKNARSKRALEARAPKEIESERTAIFVRGSHTGDVLNSAMKDLMLLKRPHAISFSKKNIIHPFEPDGISSLEFWSNKNDATFFVVGTSTKKRPNSLTLVRTFDGKVLDMCELGVTKFVPMEAFKTKKSTPGYKPLMHFASPLFDTHPRLMQLRSLLLCLFNGEAIDSIALAGIEHVISVQLGPLPTTSTSTPAAPLPGSIDDDLLLFPQIFIRTYTLALKSSSTRVPYIDLVPMGPSLDLVLRRHLQADPVLLAESLKRPKLAKKDVESGLGDKKKMRNKEVDEMGDLRGRVHIAKQDLNKLQTRKVKALKKSWEEMDVDEEDVQMNGVGQETDSVPRKRRRNE